MDPITIAAIAGGALVVVLLVWRSWPSAAAAPAETTATGGRKTKDEIVRLLEAQGYKVKDVEFDDGHYEVEAIGRDGEEYELKVDAVSGTILKVEKD